LLTQSAVRAHDRVGMVLFTDRVEKVLPPLGGRNRTSRLVAEIISIEPRGQGTDVAHALDYLDSVSSRRSISFILSDMHGGPFHRQVRRMADRHEIVPVWLLDPTEINLPNAGMVRLRDMETGQQVLIDTSHRPARDAFAARQAKRRSDLRSQMTRLGLDLVEVETNKPYIHPILKFFQRRDQRRRVLA
ncbi:MAG: VWA domain-containing protein, partial [Pseudomonadota bacterium]